MFGSKLLPYMTKAANQMTKLFGEKGFQKDIGKTATLTAHVAGGIANIGIFAVKHYEGVKHFGEALTAIWAVGKVYKYFKIFSDITSVFGGQRLKVNRLTSAYDDQTLAIERNTKAKEANVDAGNGTSAIDNVADSAGGEGKIAKDVEKDGKTTVHDIDDTSKVAEDTGRVGRFAKLAEKFKGVSKFGKVVAGSVGVLDVLNSATDLIGMKKKTAGSHIGAATGSQVGQQQVRQLEQLFYLELARLLALVWVAWLVKVLVVSLVKLFKKDFQHKKSIHLNYLLSLLSRNFLMKRQAIIKTVKLRTRRTYNYFIKMGILLKKSMKNVCKSLRVKVLKPID